jgi:GTP-binding protein
MRLVDMPGYGFAAVSKEKISSWTQLMHAYLRGRSSLARVFVLVDGRHGLKPPDLEMMDLLDKSAMSYQVVLTKKDEVKKSDIEARMAGVLEGLAKRPAAHPEIIFTSSENGDGIGELREGIARLLSERGTVF